MWILGGQGSGAGYGGRSIFTGTEGSSDDAIAQAQPN